MTWLERWQKSWLVMGAVVLVVALMAPASVNATPAECAYTIRWGDTLGRIADWHGTTPQALAEFNGIPNPDVIYAGDIIDTCVVATSSARMVGEPTLLEIPEHAQRWADMVALTAPEWSTHQDRWFLVAVAGPESNWCTHVVNDGDRSANGRWGPSVGCPQIRTLLRADDLASSPHRDRAWLEDHMVNQAVAAWVIYERQGVGAWGPTRDGKMPDGTCVGSRWPETCSQWFAVAEAVLANTPSYSG